MRVDPKAALRTLVAIIILVVAGVLLKDYDNPSMKAAIAFLVLLIVILINRYYTRKKEERERRNRSE